MQMIENQLEARRIIRNLADEWEDDFKIRYNRYFDTLISDIQNVSIKMPQIRNAFDNLKSLKVNRKWNFVYKNLQNYFDLEDILSFSQEVESEMDLISKKIAEEKSNFNGYFNGLGIFDNVEKLISELNTKRNSRNELVFIRNKASKSFQEGNRAKQMNEHSFQMIKEMKTNSINLYSSKKE